MSQHSSIQWTDGTVNPAMGCSVLCELRPSAEKVCKSVVEFFQQEFPTINPARIEELVNELTTDHNGTEIYQLREEIVEGVIKTLENQPRAPKQVKAMVKRLKDQFDGIFICYAHQQHLIRGTDITNPDKITNPGYAPQFEKVTLYPGRVAEAAAASDLYGKTHKQKPWLDYLPRLIFVSDMADALSEKATFEFLKKEIVDVSSSERGSQHIWLWLTKVPKRMAEFGKWLQSQGSKWPDNLVAMATVTSKKTIVRVNQLKTVPARFKALSVEPLWEEVTLPLDGIDWCIVGGQSGRASKPFDVAWAESLLAQCKASGTALFMKQLGAKPKRNGDDLELKDEHGKKDKHGGDWSLWPLHLRIRDVPKGFYSLRAEIMHSSA